MISIIDYGMGNLRSVQKALELIGFDAKITSNPIDLQNASHIILPGVGAFNQAMDSLNKTGIKEEMLKQIEKGKPFLGICLGMQMLFDKSFEDGEFEGLHIIHGQVKRFENISLKVPHMGWNQVEIKKDVPLFKDIDDYNFYFVHSYHASDVKNEDVMTITNYGYNFVSSVNKDNVYGVQFHPEKSGDTGLKLLKNFGGIK